MCFLFTPCETPEYAQYFSNKTSEKLREIGNVRCSFI